MKKQTFFKLLIISLLLVSISCNLISTLTRTPTPEAPIQPPAQQYVPDPSAFSVSITQAEMNAYLTSSVASNPDSPIKNPVVTLPEGLIELSGQLIQGPLNVDMKLTARPYVDAEGNLKVELQQADLGPVPVSQSMLDAISVYIEDALTSSLGAMSAEYRVNSILITGGVLTLYGEPR